VLETKPNANGDVIDGDVANRLARQSVLTREEPPLVWTLIDEGVLYRPVASPPVMYDQLAHLSEMSRRPNVTIQVVPLRRAGT
jgi:Domain of unknown function (DUF5753)